MVNRSFAQSRVKCTASANEEEEWCWNGTAEAGDCNVCKGGECGDDCGSICDEGHTGFLCGVCAPLYSRESYLHRCEKCNPATAVGFVLMVLNWMVNGLLGLVFAWMAAAAAYKDRPSVQTVSAVRAACGILWNPFLTFSVPLLN